MVPEGIGDFFVHSIDLQNLRPESRRPAAFPSRRGLTEAGPFRAGLPGGESFRQAAPCS